MKLILLTLPVLALAIAGCARTAPAPACDDGGKDPMAYIDQRTAKLDIDPDTGDILDPATGRVAITRAQAACIVSEDQVIINAAGGTPK